ncbi:MAG: hypothetical protein QOC93_162 [Actinomycetota bacterium]|jgi:hypothetical protein|nr:hypothetical protein [Cryptosporangiaceae bacterium]MDQ1675018.1 hypothetical protein [Actinomycetota bacterium]
MQHSNGPVALAVLLWAVVIVGLGYGVVETLRTVAALFGG